MLKVAKFVIMLSLLTMAFEASAARFSRPDSGFNTEPNYDEMDDNSGIPDRYQGRIPRIEDNYDSEGEVDPEGENGDYANEDRPSFRPSNAPQGDSSFGASSGRVQFKLVGPNDKPINPRAASYERYKKYHRR